MTRSTTALSALIVCFASAAIAQMGHPLVGTWSGYWGQTADERNRVLLLLDYADDRITGVINPGRYPAPITSASLDPETWTVVLEGNGEDRGGNAVAYRVEGRIGNVTSATRRSLSGTWIQNGRRGNFEVTLN